MTAEAVGTAITGAITSVFGFMGTAFQEMISNPVLVLFLGGTAIGLGVRAFVKLRRAA